MTAEKVYQIHISGPDVDVIRAGWYYACEWDDPEGNWGLYNTLELARCGEVEDATYSIDNGWVCYAEGEGVFRGAEYRLDYDLLRDLADEAGCAPHTVRRVANGWPPRGSASRAAAKVLRAHGLLPASLLDEGQS